jgi:RimJ/RimL family protein N-acetyltransferase
MDVRLRTERLILRRPTEADIPAVVAGFNDYEVVRYLTRVQYPYTEADARAWLAAREPPRPDNAHFGIELPGEGLVGFVSLETELGFWLARHRHGHGLMTEACTALLDWHFDALPDDIVHSGAHVGNEASLNVQRKLGFVQWPGTQSRLVRSLGREVPHILTTLSRVDYEAAGSRLRSRSWT